MQRPRPKLLERQRHEKSVKQRSRNPASRWSPCRCDFDGKFSLLRFFVEGVLLSEGKMWEGVGVVGFGGERNPNKG